MAIMLMSYSDDVEDWILQDFVTDTQVGRFFERICKECKTR